MGGVSRLAKTNDSLHLNKYFSCRDFGQPLQERKISSAVPGNATTYLVLLSFNILVE